MNENRKEEIIMATLKLASQNGLRAVSMNMIAESIGIRKPSLYNHFKSKEQLVNEMYVFLRNKAMKNTNTSIDKTFFENKTAFEILNSLVENYIRLCSDKNIEMFYKVIYSERTISRVAAQIMVCETQKMILATKQVFEVLQNKNLLQFDDIDVCATSFALTIHALMDYLTDASFSQNGIVHRNFEPISKFILEFVNTHKYKE